MHPAGGLLFAENSFAEVVEVDPHPGGTARGEVSGQRRLFAWDDDPGGVPPDPRGDRGHRRPRQEPGDEIGGPEQQAFDGQEVTGEAELIQDFAELGGLPLGPAAAEDMVHHGQRECLAVGIVYHPGETAGLRSFLPRLTGRRSPQ